MIAFSEEKFHTANKTQYFSTPMTCKPSNDTATESHLRKEITNKSSHPGSTDTSQGKVFLL